jgi:class 3 adenylate cyclase
MLVRMGINLGPVKLVQDINGRTNALGDGINAGQRVMSFAADNQILADLFSELATNFAGNQERTKFLGAMPAAVWTDSSTRLEPRDQSATAG